MQKKLLLIDGNNLFHRAYHALPPLTDKSGENANAVYGFSNMLLKAVDEVRPRYVACAFDTAAPTFRHIEFEKYKAQRPPPPPDLYPQLPKVKKVLDVFGIPFFEKAGYEADDILASLASKFQIPNDKLQIVILSGDRDVLQLVDGYIKVQMPGWNLPAGKVGLTSTTFFGAEEVEEKFGITPAQMVDFKSLTGDPSDNVPGVAGIGPKTAADLLQKYGSVEGIYEHVKETPLRVREKLEAGKEVALAAKSLIKLDTNVDLATCLPAGRFTIDDLRYNPDWEKVRAEFEELGFKSIVAKLPGENVSSSFAQTSDGKQVSKVSKDKKENSNQLELI